MVCLPKSVDNNRTSAAVMAATSTARPAQMSRPCRLVGSSSVSSSTDQASSGSSPGGGGTWVVSASAPCSDAAVSSVLTEVTLGPPTGVVQAVFWGQRVPQFGYTLVAVLVSMSQSSCTASQALPVERG